MWFTENPWPPIIGLCVIGVLLFLRFLSVQRSGYLAGVALCAALCGGVWLVERQIVTEREQVEQRLLELVTTFQQESVQQGLVNILVGSSQLRTLTFISNSAKEVQGLVVTGMQMVDVADDVRISDVQTSLTNNNSRAVVHFRASATISAAGYGNVGRHPTRWELTWQRENGEWKVIRAKRLNFMTGEEVQNPLTQKE